jgi:hypothetical protein
VNAQLPITTTPKYNFPLSNENLQLPHRLIELSMRSLQRPPNPPSTSLQGVPRTCTLDHVSFSSPEAELIKLTPNLAKTPIAAVDVASMAIGETERGTLLAVRGAIVWKISNHYRYLRLGPFPFHITDIHREEFRDVLRENHRVAFSHDYALPNILHAQARLTAVLERWMQAFVNQTLRDSLILWDGSLTASTFGTSPQAMRKLLKEARNRQNTILAFSKMTRLLLHGTRITDLVWQHPPPCLLKMETPSPVGALCFLGSMYVAKLTKGGLSFRMDVDGSLSDEQAVEGVQKLLGNDVVLQSYPETLRLAHILSTFTASEVIGLQRYIVKERGMKIVIRPNVRRLLFGRFGKGSEG